MILVALYLAAIVAANLLVAEFGPWISVWTAFVLIGLDLTTRDALHERWHHDHLALRMAALIAVGSALSWIINRDAGRIAVASMIAFGAAATVDALAYAVLHRRPWLVRSNGSNVLGAAVDSLVFPTIAFGGLLPLVTLGQFAAKVGGGFVWSLLIARFRAAPDPEGAPERAHAA